MVDFIRDDAEALMQYGSNHSHSDSHEAHQLWLEIPESCIVDSAMTDDEIAADCNRRQEEADKYREELAAFLWDWSSL